MKQKPQSDCQVATTNTRAATLWRLLHFAFRGAAIEIINIHRWMTVIELRFEFRSVPGGHNKLGWLLWGFPPTRVCSGCTSAISGWWFHIFSEKIVCFAATRISQKANQLFGYLITSLSPLSIIIYSVAGQVRTSSTVSGLEDEFRRSWTKGRSAKESNNCNN